ncbi:MAG: DUF86 domain-containing protein [Candidatus Margulisbacteria bacterium]|jgi:uncharacterized protein with HEPN domain|nr:DUF86 domain-containing protein [Candidatus Margulisiibacteriota bacterium]
MSNSKDTSLLKHIIKHCEAIVAAQKRFGDNFEVFKSDADYFNSVCMSLLQIGELANHLSAEFKTKHKMLPWPEIIGLRNVVVHGYGQLDAAIVWATLNEDVPKLRQYCAKLMSLNK